MYNFPAFVRAYSDSGAHVDALAGPLGHYALGVDAGEAWHVQAVSEDTALSGTVTVTTFLKSPRAALTPTVGANSLDLALQPSDTLPESLAFDFEAAVDQVFTLSNGAQTLNRVPETAGRPAGPPAHFGGLIGEYGWDHNTLLVFEKDQKLHALIEWFFLYPLEDEGKDTFAFPDYGLYPGEKLVFTRDKAGRASKVVAAGVTLWPARRPVRRPVTPTKSLPRPRPPTPSTVTPA